MEGSGVWFLNTRDWPASLGSVMAVGVVGTGMAGDPQNFF
jgi:hypothetical protein